MFPSLYVLPKTNNDMPVSVDEGYFANDSLSVSISVDVAVFSCSAVEGPRYSKGGIEEAES